MTTSNEQIYQAVVDLAQTGRIASRETVAQVVNLPMGIVDDHLKRLVNDERLKRPARGVYESVAAAPEDRAISVTVLPTGRVKLEVGDEVLDLSFREARAIGASMVGFTFQFRV